jgi:hypothetical protein
MVLSSLLPRSTRPLKCCLCGMESTCRMLFSVQYVKKGAPRKTESQSVRSSRGLPTSCTKRLNAHRASDFRRIGTTYEYREYPSMNTTAYLHPCISAIVPNASEEYSTMSAETWPRGDCACGRRDTCLFVRDFACMLD